MLHIFLALFVALLAACNDSKPRPPWVPPAPVIQGCGAGWTVNPLVNGVQYGPTSCSPEGHFVFPACPAQPQRQDGMHTLVKPTGPLPPGATVAVDFEITGADTFVGAQEQASPAYVSLFIQRAGDNGRFQLSQQLIRDQWVSVSTPGTEEGFQALLQNAERVGIVFGTAQSGRAHGVCTGNASTQFIMHSFTVQ